MSITVYHRLTPDGKLHEQFAGLTFAPAGDNAFTVPAADLAGLTPRPGDRLRTADGKWRTVASVGPLADGKYPLTCEPEGGGA